MRSPCVTCFSVQKEGLTPEQNEDRHWIAASPTGGIKGPARIALCDGASASAFSRPWAQILARAFARGELSAPALHELPRLQRIWRHLVSQRAMNWALEAQAVKGAWASLLGVTFHAGSHPERQTHYHAVGIGDTCLLHVRRGVLLRSFPLMHSRQFSNRPVLVPSVGGTGNDPGRQTQTASGTCLPGDMLLLATDALAEWFLAETEAGHAPGEFLRELRCQCEFATWVEVLRFEQAMAVDDTTLIRLDFPMERNLRGGPP